MASAEVFDCALGAEVIQASRPMSTENNLHHITNGREVLRPSALLYGGNSRLLLYVSEQSKGAVSFSLAENFLT